MLVLIIGCLGIGLFILGMLLKRPKEILVWGGLIMLLGSSAFSSTISRLIDEQPTIIERIEIHQQSPWENIKLKHPLCIKTINTEYYWASGRNKIEYVISDTNHCQDRSQ